MAYEDPVKCLGTLTAAASLTTKQYYIVKKNTTANQAAICDTAGEVFLGVLQNKPASGEACDIMVLGVAKVSANETLAAGDLWGTSADGQATKVEASATGADIRSYFGGQVLIGASTGELATVTVGFQTGQVSA